MKKFLILLIVFASLFFITDKLFYWKIISLPNRELDKRLEFILEGKINKKILIFGSSRAQHNIYSDKMQVDLAKSTYNLGYRGSNIVFQLFLLEKVLKHNKKPELVLLTVDGDKEFLPEKTLQFRYDKLYPLLKYQEITMDLVQQKQISPFASILYCARLGWDQFSGSKKPTHFDQWTVNGTTLLTSKAIPFKAAYSRKNKYNKKLEIQENVEAFLKFQEICSNNKIQLMVLIPPNFGIENTEFAHRISSLINDKNILLLNHHKTDFESSSLFYDESHLNKKGAILYTNEIIKKIKYRNRSITASL
jgi:hypothetical protein